MKNILFVDDDVAVLDGIRTMLHRRRNEWCMEFVDSGAAAIAAMEKQPYDLICSDMRMPVMDGAQLLTIANQRWPQTVRIVLSGYAQMEQTIRLVPVAHQYLAKPCQAEQFGNVLERCLKVQEFLQRPTLRALVGRVKKLPSLPRTYEKLRHAMAQTNISTAEIAKIVSADVAISAKVLQVVNSAFFRLAKRITKIEQAVAYLGFSTVRNLVLSVEVFSQWSKSAAKTGFDPERMQSQALLRGNTARALAKGAAFVDDALVAGLLSDIGYLILVSECPDQLQHAQKMAVENQKPLYEAEKSVLGASHAEVGAYLLALWGFPYPLVEAVANHHEPKAVTQSEFDLLGVLAIATALTDGAENKSAANAINAEYLQTIHAPFTWEQAEECAREIKAAGDAAGATT